MVVSEPKYSVIHDRVTMGKDLRDWEMDTRVARDFKDSKATLEFCIGSP
jgi:hypothetical protein